MQSSQLDSRRSSVQHGMVDKLAAFMATIFMPNLIFISPPVSDDPDSQKRHHKSVRTKILCRMHRSAYSQLSRKLFSWLFLCLLLGATFKQLLGNFQATSWRLRTTSGQLSKTFGQLSENFRTLFSQYLGKLLLFFSDALQMNCSLKADMTDKVTLMKCVVELINNCG